MTSSASLEVWRTTHTLWTDLLVHIANPNARDYLFYNSESSGHDITYCSSNRLMPNWGCSLLRADCHPLMRSGSGEKWMCSPIIERGCSCGTSYFGQRVIPSLFTCKVEEMETQFLPRMILTEETREEQDPARLVQLISYELNLTEDQVMDPRLLRPEFHDLYASRVPQITLVDLFRLSGKNTPIVVPEMSIFVGRCQTNFFSIFFMVLVTALLGYLAFVKFSGLPKRKKKN